MPNVPPSMGSLRVRIVAAPKAKTYRAPWLELGTAAELAARLKAKPAAATSAKKKGKR